MLSKSITESIVAWEEGTLEFEEEIRLFQHLVNTGMAWSLQGFYGRHAQHLLEEGYIHPPEEKINPVAKKKDVKRRGRGRPTTKRKGAMVSMMQRRNKGNGIILDRIENLKQLTQKELRQQIIKMKPDAIVPHITERMDAGLEKFANYNNYVLIHWFEKPSDYDMETSYYNRGWYPDKWVKVISPAPPLSKKENV